jgi:hypothetical protein
VRAQRAIRCGRRPLKQSFSSGLDVQRPYFPLRLILSLVAGFLFVPVWLAIFNLFGLNGWGFFHSGLPILIDSAVTYWVLGYLPPFKRPKDTPPQTPG